MKPLLPSLREKKRYIVIEIIGNKINVGKSENQIYQSIIKFLGELGVSRANIKIISDSWKGNKGIIKTNVKYVDEVKVALGLIKKLENKDIIVNVVGVSGILKKAKSKFMEE